MGKGKEIAIKVEGVSKSFRLPHERNTSVKSIVVNPFKKRTFEKQEVLKNINFEIKKGEFFGIVGRNGSGKSTLLKLLAGIYWQDEGTIQINGKLTPFIELGVGFNPELTGQENVYLNGALLGFNRKEMEKLYDDIVVFAELGKFMDQKLKNYSSGMQVRLAFSIAIQANSDILLLDEVLAVGDEAFQKKCFEYFARLKRENKTVILVSHDMESVKRFCDRAIFIDKGELKAEGNTKQVTQAYTNSNLIKEEKPKKTAKKLGQQITGTFEGELVVSCNGSKKITETIQPHNKIIIQIRYTNALTDKEIDAANMGITLEDESGKTVFRANTEDAGGPYKNINPGGVITVIYEIDNIFPEGKYYLDVDLSNPDRTITYKRIDDAMMIIVSGRGRYGWLLFPRTKIDLLPLKRDNKL